VAGDKIRRGHQIGRPDRLVTETEVRTGKTSRFLRVVLEITLAILIGSLPDDLDGILVGAHGSVGPQSVKFGLVGSLGRQVDFRFQRQRFESHIVHNPDRKIVFRLRHVQVFIYRQDLRRRGILGTQSITASHNDGGTSGTVEK